MTSHSPTGQPTPVVLDEGFRAQIQIIETAIAELSPESQHYRTLKKHYEGQIREMESAAVIWQDFEQSMRMRKARFRRLLTGLALLAGVGAICFAIYVR